MGFFGTGKRTEHHEEAAIGSHDQQPKHESIPPQNFFSKMMGKQTEHHDDQEAGGGSHDQQHPPQKNLFARILGKPTEQHPNHELHPPKRHFFARILHRLELFLRISTLAFLVAGVVVLAVNQASTITRSSGGSGVVSTLRILDLASYKYILAAIIIGQTYIIVQIVVSLCRMVTGIQRGFIMLYFDFIGDKILSYLLATGAAAAYGSSINMEINGSSSSYSEGKIAASLVLIAFLFSALSSVISSHSLPKHPCFL